MTNRKALLRTCERILDEVTIAQKQMQTLSGNAGHIDIAYVFHLLPLIFPTVRCFLNKPKNENVTFNFHQSHTGEMIRGLKNERFDVIFGSYVEGDLRFSFVLS